MTEHTKTVQTWPSANRVRTTDGVSKSVPSGNSQFTPIKPANVIRPQGIKPPPPRHSNSK